jgi:hypothetical protein
MRSAFSWFASVALRTLRLPAEIVAVLRDGVGGHRVEAEGLACRNGRSPDWLKTKSPAAQAVKREAEEDWNG